jgi:hypothetical protein
MFAHETAGAACIRLSLRPLYFWANEFAKLGRNVSRERGVMFVARMSEATSGISRPAYRSAHAGYRLFEN